MSRAATDRLHTLARFSRDESAATAIEYSLIAALMSMAAIVAFLAMGDSLSELWESLGEEIDNGNN